MPFLHGKNGLLRTANGPLFAPPNRILAPLKVRVDFDLTLHYQRTHSDTGITYAAEVLHLAGAYVACMYGDHVCWPWCGDGGTVRQARVLAFGSNGGTPTFGSGSGSSSVSEDALTPYPWAIIPTGADLVQHDCGDALAYGDCSPYVIPDYPFPSSPQTDGGRAMVTNTLAYIVPDPDYGGLMAVVVPRFYWLRTPGGAESGNPCSVQGVGGYYGYYARGINSGSPFTFTLDAQEGHQLNEQLVASGSVTITGYCDSTDAPADGFLDGLASRQLGHSVFLNSDRGFLLDTSSPELLALCCNPPSSSSTSSSTSQSSSASHGGSSSTSSSSSTTSSSQSNSGGSNSNGGGGGSDGGGGSNTSGGSNAGSGGGGGSGGTGSGGGGSNGSSGSPIAPCDNPQTFPGPGLPLCIDHNDGVTWSATGGNPGGCLKTSGAGAWWLFNLPKWAVANGDSWAYSVDITLGDGSGGREIADVLFWVNGVGAEARGFVFRVETGGGEASSFYHGHVGYGVEDFGPFGGVAIPDTLVSGGLYRVTLSCGGSSTITAAIEDLATSTVVGSITLDFAPYVKTGYRIGGTFGQNADGAGSLQYWDNITLTGGGASGSGSSDEADVVCPAIDGAEDPIVFAISDPDGVSCSASDGSASSTTDVIGTGLPGYQSDGGSFGIACDGEGWQVVADGSSCSTFFTSTILKTGPFGTYTITTYADSDGSVYGTWQLTASAS